MLTIGLLLTLFNASLGVGASVGVPFTNSNITLAGAVGKKENADASLPNYVQDKVGSNKNFVNSTSTLTIWVAEGIVVFVVGHQEGAPAIDLHLVLK